MGNDNKQSLIINPEGPSHSLMYRYYPKTYHVASTALGSGDTETNAKGGVSVLRSSWFDGIDNLENDYIL